MGIMTARLRAAADPKYRAFMAGILPTVDARVILGVRARAMDTVVRELRGTPTESAFLHELPHEFYDEDALHARLITGERDFRVCLERLDAFLPFVNNWGVCDGLAPRVFASHTAEVLPLARAWTLSPRPYVCRFGLGVLMRNFLDAAFSPDQLVLAASVHSDEYYVKMMVAWYFATALAKQRDAVLPYLTERRLEPRTHAMTIRKAVESRRIDPALKAFLKTLRGGEH